MEEINQFRVAVTMRTADKKLCLLETKAHTITLATDGTLSVIGERQKRTIRPDMWVGIQLEWIDAKPPYKSSLPIEFDGPPRS